VLDVCSSRHAFGVNTQAEGEAKPTQTVLAAENEIRYEDWTSALERAMLSLKPKGATGGASALEEQVPPTRCLLPTASCLLPPASRLLPLTPSRSVRRRRSCARRRSSSCA